MHYVSLVLMTHQPEFCYLDEWVQHHTLIGIDHFYVCLDGGGDYQSGNRRVEILRTTQSQVETYRCILRDYGRQSQWMGFIDTDEFVRLVTDECIHSLLRDYEEYSALSS